MYGEHFFHDGRLDDTLRRLDAYLAKEVARRDARLRFARWRARRDRAHWQSPTVMPEGEGTPL